MESFRTEGLLEALGFVIGIFIGRQFLFYNLSLIKLMHIMGLIYNLFSVLILSYFFHSSERIKNFIATWGLSITLAFGGLFWIGFYFGILFYNIPSASKNLAIIAYLPITLFAQFTYLFLDIPIRPPFFPMFKSLDTRIKILGFFYLFSTPFENPWT